MSQPGTPPEHASRERSLRLTEHGPIPTPAPTPKSGRAGPISLNEPPAEAYDALADLFLGPREPASHATAEPHPVEREAPHEATGGNRLEALLDEQEPNATGTAEPARGGATIEGLVLGHLPVIASAWVAQYARDLAHREGKPVAMLRRYGPRVSLDLIGVRLESPCDRLEDALALASSRVDRWLIRVDDTDEPGLAECGRLHALTLLTGADEAATVASYRTLKSLAGIFEGGGPDLTLAIMGAPADRARHAAAKLQKAARTFLNRDVRTACTARRIAAALSCTLYRGESDLDLTGLLDRLGDAHEGTPSRHAQAQMDSTPQRVPVHPARGDAEPRVAPTVAPAIDDGSVWVNTRPQGTPADDGDRSRGYIEPDGVWPEHTIGLLANVEPIAARCPHAPDVELGVGPTGRVHVVARATRDEHDQALRRVLAAAGWARLNASLLALTDARVGVTNESGEAEQDEPVLHMVTDDARAARPLLDADVRLHLCQRVGDGSAWACSPLN